MNRAEDIIKPYQVSIKQFDVPDYLADVVTVKDAIKLIDIARNEAILECADAISKKETEHGRYIDIAPILSLIQKI